ncbi:MAG: hypothetical protein ACRC9L_00615 [Brevinema sp.]
MLFLQKLRIFFASRSTRQFLRVFFLALPLSLTGIYFVFYSDYGMKLWSKQAQTRDLIQSILYDPITHNTNSIYLPDVFRGLREITTYTKPDTLWEGTALDPLYQLPKHGTPKTSRSEN